MVVMLSAEVLDETEDQRVEFLLGLLHDETIALHRYSDAGPPMTAERIRVRSWEGTRGWVVFEPYDGPVYGVLGKAVTVRDDRITEHGVNGGDVFNLAVELGADLYADKEREAAKNLIRADVLAGLIAEDIGADLLVTRRSILLKQPFDITRGLACMSPEEALPIVGLYLRQQGSHVIYRGADGKQSYSVNRGYLWSIAARDLLPSGWKWTSACVEQSRATRNDTLTWLAGSVYQRLERALRARDRIHAALLVPQNNDTADEALAELDVLLVSLMGAFDAAAIVTDVVLSLETKNPSSIAWQRESWRTAVRRACPELADIVAQGTEGWAVLEVLRLLRNSVHGEALPSLAVLKSPTRVEDTMVGLPRASRDQILEAVRLLGGSESWGIRQMISERLHADIQVLVERLLPAATTILDSLLAATPVERLSDVDPAKVTTAPPEKDAFALPYRQRIRWQLGLD